MTIEEKEAEYIEWFKNNSTPEQFKKSIMIMACAAGSMEIDNDGIDSYIYHAVDSKSKVTLTVKRYD